MAAHPNQPAMSLIHGDSPPAIILSMTKFHAVMGTTLLATTTATNWIGASHHHHYYHDNAGATNKNANTGTITTNITTNGSPALELLTYVHLWCAALGLAWWWLAMWKPVLHVLCAGMLSALVVEMGVIAARAVFGTGNDAAAGGVCPSHVNPSGSRQVVVDATAGGGNLGGGKVMNEAISDSRIHEKMYSWVAGKLMGAGPLTAIGGPIGIILSAMWPGLGWCLRIAAWALGRVLPLLLHALPGVRPAAKWLFRGTVFVIAWAAWTVRLVLRLCWGPA
ncbi:hypothetical protein VTJ49DRAFT_4161 [Mycothermus thermophilus]|uniref:Uncharacterized protein n=1 Tax=Humicola insolens TaxID=85995 RepID=A0ABR3V634_HUMIN